LDILDIIKTRRSVRRFTEHPPDDEVVRRVLEAGRWAPSGLNNQPWRFAVIREEGLKERISDLTRYSRIVRSAPLLIAVFLDTSAAYDRTKDLQAIGACIQNMLLEIHSLGLGAVWLGEILQSGAALRDLLGLGGELELMAVVAMGHPAEGPRQGRRRALRDLVVFRG